MSLFQLTLLGVPAEETLGAKLTFSERGVLIDRDIAMLAHPWNVATVEIPNFLSSATLVHN